MKFCEGELRFYESLMQGVPNFDKRPLTAKEKNCKYCACYDRRKKRCKRGKCPYFN